MTTSLLSPTSPARLDDLSEDERNEAFDRLQERLPDVWRAMRANDPRESVVVVPSMSIERMVPGSGASNQRTGGALSVHAAAAATAPAQAGLRDLDARRPGGHRVLPVPAPGGDPQPRQGPAVAGLRGRLLGHPADREAAGPAADGQPASVPSFPTRPSRTWCPTTRPGSNGTSPCCSAYPCTAPTPATSPRHEDRLPRGLCRGGDLAPHGGQRRPDRRRRRDRPRPTAVRASQSDRRHGQAQRGRVRAPATPRSTSRACPPAATPRSATPCATA